MQKINSYYSDQQVENLKALSEVTGHKVSELLRRAVDMYLDHARSRGLLIDPHLRIERQDDGLPEATSEEVQEEKNS